MVKKNKKVRVHIFVSGRVQGVFFRENTKREAEKLTLFGWVKNLTDGRVEMIFEGDKKDVEKMIDWVRKGPIGAKVEKIDIIWEAEGYKSEFDRFKINYDFG